MSKEENFKIDSIKTGSSNAGHSNDNVSKNSQNDNQEKMTPTKAVENNKNTIVFLLLFVAIALSTVSVAGAYYLYQLQLEDKKIIANLTQSFNQSNQQLKQSNENIKINEKLDLVQSTNIQKINQQISHSEKVSQQAINTVNRNQRGWVLAEVDYLLRMAHQRIAVARDVKGAIAALKGADERLHQLGDLSLFKVREQLIIDIANLNAIQLTDSNGISMAIDSLVQHIKELPFKEAKDEIKSQLTDQKVSSLENAEDKTLMDSVLDTIREIGDIKVHKKDVNSATDAIQHNQIEQLLNAYLLGVRFAALRYDEKQFKYEIHQASEIIRLHYDTNDNRVKQLQETLLNYSTLQLAPDLPELTKAWSLLNKNSKNQQEKISDDELPIKVKPEPIKTKAPEVKASNVGTSELVKE